MADEDLLPPEGEERTDAPIEGSEQAPDPIANLAQELGWVPQEQFKGDPEKWKPADQFIRDGRDIQQSTSKELRSMREQMERLSGVSSQILADKLAERDAYWQQQHAKAVDEGDHEAAKRAVEELRKPAAAQPAGPPPEVQSWVSKNEWFTKDPIAAARARTIADDMARQGLGVQQQLEAAERVVKREFPEHFATPAKAPPATQTAQSRTAAPTNRQRGFADMPAASQQMAIDYEKRLGVSKDAFAKSYWAEKGVSR